MTNPEELGIRGKHIEIPVGGMSCGGCAQTVQQALFALAGVTAARVSHTDAKAQVYFEPERVTVEQIREAIRRTGYQAGEPLAASNADSRQGRAEQSCCYAKK